MKLITNDTCRTFLNRFDSFDGACIRQISFSYPEENKSKCMDIFFSAFDNTASDRRTNDKGPPNKWVFLQLQIEGVKELIISEGPRISYVQPDDHIEIQWIGKVVYLIFDPLQSKKNEKDEWTIEEIRSSKFYVGGNFCYYHIHGPVN